MENLLALLEVLGMAHCAEAFRVQKIEFDLLQDLTDKDLETIGISALGDRKRLLKAFSALSRDAQSVPEISAATDPAPATASPAPAFRPAGIDGERRQLSVMFCDLVASTEMATRMDPEDFQRVVAVYHDAVAGAVAPHSGYVAQFLGDGVLVYFGYPHANEDAVASAIRAAVDVVSAVSRLSPQPALPTTLQTRIGIATGLVVVGHIGTGTTAAELSATGETPNLAARLQGLAAPGRIVISERTRAMVENAFELEPLGDLMLKGFSAPMPAWQVVGERQAASRFEARHAHQLSPFVGRDSEVALLLDRWGAACEGEGQAVLISGEAGIGKSRLAQTFRKRVEGGVPSETILLQCSPSHRNSALYPVVRALEVAARITAAHSTAEREALLVAYLGGHGVSLEQSSLACLRRLMAPPDDSRESVADATRLQQKDQTLQTLTDIVLSFSRRAPVLLIPEDAHWIDPTTEEWIAKAVDQLRDARVLILITSRPEYAPTWGNPANLTRLSVNKLNQRQAALLIEAVAGESLPDQAVAEIIEKTEGMPLFIEELTKTVLDAAAARAKGRSIDGTLQSPVIPATLQDSLMARLDRLGTAKEVAQVAATIGREFSQELLFAVLQMTADDFEKAVEELLRAEIIFKRSSQAEALYSFKHALIRDIAYNSMVRSRRASLHGRIALAMERVSPTLATTQPELLALHHQEAGNAAEAIRYLHAAGDIAWSRAAVREATIHFASALALLARQPASLERNETELTLSLKQGHALSVTSGYGSQDTYRSFERARGIAQELGRLDDFVRAWASSAPTLFGAGRPGEVIESMRNVTSQQMDLLPKGLRVDATTILGVANFLMGHSHQAWEYLESARKLDDVIKLTHLHPIGGGDPAIALRAYSLRCAAMQGHLDRAASISDEAMAIAAARGHAPSIAWAKQGTLHILLWKGDYAQAEAMSMQLIEFAERFGIKTRIGFGLVNLGRATIALGRVDEGAVFLRRGCDVWASSGGKFHLAEMLAHGADNLLRVGRIDEARAFLAEAQAVQATTDERYYESELLRIAGRLLQVDGDVQGAGSAYLSALATSERQGMLLLALRAACDWARLRAGEGRAEEALALLKPVYSRFQEGHDYVDLRDARALLEELSR
ncbi:adenylate/guanylate cyclase domain-containing protein [Variovorax sp. dw_308]|uniref:adenylate/guanylate cyclase domain-containing protein n=1 Tax=Variovorax sp. dw_308 TaxID=2721546 RepID=UPI001C449C41|nr:adenylate/guanylate cyclase domain-containing protein [Variovorax sp. dw_308]